MPDLDAATVYVYALGLASCSACVPRPMATAAIEAAVNTAEPTGISSPWRIADEPFADGTPNPSPCDTSPAVRCHYLLHC